MELIKSFVITLVTTLIFITAIELIGPDNSMKKYLKFVMGLLLIAVILNPIISFFTNGESVISQTIDKYEKEISSKSNKDIEDNKDTIKQESFKNNFNKNCENLLKKEYKNMEFLCDVQCKVDFEKPTLIVDNLRVGIKNGKVKEVQKVEIGKDTVQKSEDETQKSIKSFLSNELGIEEKKIVVYYM